MGGLVIETVRPGVQFIPDAAAAFRRANAQVRAEFGRDIDVNSTFREPGTQLAMHNAWNRYVDSGYNPAYYPGHSKALHPDDPLAFHTKGSALDSDDWVNARIVEILAENGFIRNRLYVPNEQHHFEWIRSRDRNYGKPILAGPSTEEDELMGAKEDIIAHLDRKVAELDTRRDTAIVWVEGSAFVVDDGAGTKWNVARGQRTIEDAFAYIQWLRNRGFTEYKDQAPFVLAGYRDITEEGSVREEVAKALREAASS